MQVVPFLTYCLKIVTQSQNLSAALFQRTKCPCLMLLPDSGEVNRVEPQSSWLWLADYPQVNTAHTRLTQEVIGLTGVCNEADEWVMMCSNMLEHKHMLISAGDKWLIYGFFCINLWHPFHRCLTRLDFHATLAMQAPFYRRQKAWVNKPHTEQSWMTELNSTLNPDQTRSTAESLRCFLLMIMSKTDQQQPSESKWIMGDETVKSP